MEVPHIIKQIDEDEEDKESEMQFFCLFGLYVIHLPDFRERAGHLKLFYDVIIGH